MKCSNCKNESDYQLCKICRDSGLPTLDTWKKETAHVWKDKKLNLTAEQIDHATEMLYDWFLKNRKDINLKNFREILQKAMEMRA